MEDSVATMLEYYKYYYATVTSAAAISAVITSATLTTTIVTTSSITTTTDTSATAKMSSRWRIPSSYSKTDVEDIRSSAARNGTQNEIEGNSQQNVSNNHTESNNIKGSGGQVSNTVKYNKIGTLNQTFIKNAGNGTSSARDVVIDYCPTPVPTFICRDAELKALKKLFVDYQVIMLTGMGGLGKTQLARKFASDNNNDYRYRYWLESETITKLEVSFRGLAQKLRVYQSSKNVLVNDVYKALENISTLLIFDNVEKPADVYDYLPTRFEMTNAKVHVLVTSRWTVWTCDLSVECYPLKPLDELTSLQLFKKNFGKAYMKIDESMWKKLANNLGYLPLALQVAASYIIGRHNVNTDLATIVTKYIEQLANDAKQLLTDTLIHYDKSSIHRSMMITLELIEEKQDAEPMLAVRLINVASYMDPDRIYRKHLLQLFDGDDKEHLLDGALVILTEFSLMNEGGIGYAGEYYTMHRIIRRSIRHSQIVKGTADDYYWVALEFAVFSEYIYNNDYVIKYADERALCVHRYHNAHPSSDLLFSLMRNGSCVALKKVFDSMDRADTKSIIDDNKWLLDQVKHKNFRMMRLLFSFGADINQRDDGGRTSLHMACMSHDTDITQWLLNYGADLCATDKNGRTPAHCAVYSGEPSMLALLLERDNGLTDPRDDEGYTPFHYMLNWSKMYSEELAMYSANIFIKYGVDVTQNTKAGQTIIHLAAKLTFSKLASLILQLNPSLINIVDNEGHTPLHVVGHSFHRLNNDDIESTIQVLLKYGLSLYTKDNQGLIPLESINRRWQNILKCFRSNTYLYMNFITT